jgi:outer membrane protein assembly factor BamB
MTHSIAAVKFPRLRTVFATLALGSLIVLGGCSKDKVVEPPAELVDFNATRKVDRVWSTGLGGDSKHLRLALRPVVADGVVYAASNKGEVYAFAANNGRRAWSVKSRLQLSAGPEVGNGVVVVGSSDGDVLALDAATGASPRSAIVDGRRRALVGRRIRAASDAARHGAAGARGRSHHCRVR